MSEIKCGCGRSPTGSCIGWHNLTNEEYQKRKTQYDLQEQAKTQQQFLREDDSDRI